MIAPQEDDLLQKLADCQAEVAGLREALESRDVIGQAKGILMAAEGISADQALDALSGEPAIEHQTS